MSVQLVGNNVSNVNFMSKHKKEDVSDARAKANAFVNMNDEQIRSLAYLTSIDKKQEKKSRRAIVATLYALPVVDVLSKGILAKGALGAPASLSKRLLRSGEAARGWVGALAVLGIYTVGNNVLMSKSDSYKQFQSNNPVASFVLDLGALAGLLTLGSYASKKIINKIITAKPELLTRKASFLKELGAKIDNSFMNKKVLSSVTKKIISIAKDSPKTASAANFLVRKSVWIVFLAGLLGASSHSIRNRNKVENRYNELKNDQLKVAKHMTNVLGVERDVLAQSQQDMAKDLRKAMDGQKPVSEEELVEFDKQKHVEKYSARETEAAEASDKSI